MEPAKVAAPVGSGTPVKKHKSSHHHHHHHKDHHHSSHRHPEKSKKHSEGKHSSNSAPPPAKPKKPMISESDSEDDIPMAVQKSVADSAVTKPTSEAMPQAMPLAAGEIKSERPSEELQNSTPSSEAVKMKTGKPRHSSKPRTTSTNSNKIISEASTPSATIKNEKVSPNGTPAVKIKTEKAPPSSTPSKIKAEKPVTPSSKVKSEKSTVKDDKSAIKSEKKSKKPTTENSTPSLDKHSSASGKVKAEKRKSKSDGSEVPMAKRKPPPEVVTPQRQSSASSKRKRPPSESEESSYDEEEESESEGDEDFKPTSAKKVKTVAASKSTSKGRPSKKEPAATPVKTPAKTPAKMPVKKTPASKKKAATGAESSATKGGRKKKEEEAPVWKWWEEEPHPDGIKWMTLEHNGPYFAPPYEPLPDEVEFLYNGEAMRLSEKAEEAAGFFAKMLDHDYTSKDVFCNNFFQDWRKEMTSEESRVIKDFSKCDFSQIHQYYKERSEARKAMSKEEKLVIKQENERLVEKYGWCMIDGHKEKIGNFKIEPPGLFRGRGDHPKQGKIKKRIEAKDVLINIGKEAKIPSPPPGQRWKEVQHDNKVSWLASWTENIQGAIKYVMLNPTSRLKAEKDWGKYETARRLKAHVDTIRAQYREDLKSKEMRVRQRAVALYFIDKLALRAGNEKDTDETADTVGCCSLRVEHIKLHEEKDGKEHVIEFDFLGKDSIRYYNCVPVDKQVFKNVRLFMDNKTGGDDLFDRLTTSLLNRHLTELMANLTAKVFRTFNASKTLQEQLDELTVESDSVTSKLLAYNRANRAVAVLCNHQRAAPKTFDQQMSNLQGKIDAKEDAIIETKAEIKALKKEARSTKDVKTTKKLEVKQRQLTRLEEQLHKLQVQATDKQENKEIALGTSKLNYLDPRISVAWCKKWDIPVEKIYNKTQRQKFAWAMDMADEDFVF